MIRHFYLSSAVIYKILLVLILSIWLINPYCLKASVQSSVGVYGLAISPDGKSLASSHTICIANFYHLPNLTLFKTYSFSAPIQRISYLYSSLNRGVASPNGQYFLLTGPRYFLEADWNGTYKNYIYSEFLTDVDYSPNST